MSALVYLGDIKLDALTVRDMPDTRTWEYAAHKVIEGIPVLQFLGRDSDIYTLNVRVHPSLGNTASIVGRVDAAGDAGEVMVLQSARGEQLGSYVLTSRERTRVWTTPDGVLVAAELSLKLKEHRPIDFVIESTIAVEGTAVDGGAQPTAINDSRNPTDVPLSEIVRSA